MHLNAFTIIIITPETLLSISFFRVWTLSSQSCLAYYYPYKTHKRQKTILYIKKITFGAKWILCFFIQSRAWKLWLLEPQYSKLSTFSLLWLLHMIHINVCVVFFLQLVSFILLFLLPTPTSQPNTLARFCLGFSDCLKWTVFLLLPKYLWKPLSIFKLIELKSYFITRKQPHSYVTGPHRSLIILHFIP